MDIGGHRGGGGLRFDNSREDVSPVRNPIIDLFGFQLSVPVIVKLGVGDSVSGFRLVFWWCVFNISTNFSKSFSLGCHVLRSLIYFLSCYLKLISLTPKQSTLC